MPLKLQADAPVVQPASHSQTVSESHGCEDTGCEDTGEKSRRSPNTMLTLSFACMMIIMTGNILEIKMGVKGIKCG